MEEIYICTQYLKGFKYSDVLALPTYERRYFLSLLTKDIREREEKTEELKTQANNKNAKGTRTTRVSGAQLKSRMKSGDIPLK